MRRRLATRAAALAVAALALFGSCRKPKPVIVPPPVVIEPAAPLPSAWEVTLDSVRALLGVRQYADADRRLARFSETHGGTQDARESQFWLALIRADPGNPDATPHEALAALDSYLALGESAPRYLEALALKRLVSASDTLRAAVVAARLAADQRDKARVDTLARRQEELDSVRTELDRIKRRLTGRRP